MFVYVFTDAEESINVALLTLMFNSCVVGVLHQADTTGLNEEGKGEGVYACAAKDVQVVRFVNDLKEKRTELFVLIVFFVFFEDGTGEESAVSCVKTADLTENGMLYLKDQAFTDRRRGESVHFTAGNNDDVPFVQNMGNIVHKDVIGVFNGHDDLDVGMPMSGIIFVLVIHVDLEPVKLVVMHYFFGSVQFFNHKEFPF